MSRLSSAWFAEQRWFSAKDTRPAEPAPAVTTTIDGDLAVSIVSVGAQRYQLVHTGGRPDSLDDPATGAALARAFAAEVAANGPAGTVAFHRVASSSMPAGAARLLGAEQSNSSVVFGDQAILKVLRRLEAGPHPEVEMLRTLVTRGAVGVPALIGWYDVTGGPVDATLGLLQEFVHDGLDGWRLILDGLASDPGGTIPLLHDLGRTLARLHDVLGAPTDDPAFAPEDGGKAVPLAIASAVVLATEALADRFPDRPDVAGALRSTGPLAVRLADRLDAGPTIRHHGDLHLGQTLHTPRGWVVIDWEGEPARPLADRRAKQPALRDVAGMLRSFSYAAATHARDGSHPIQFGVGGWLASARAAFLDGYLGAVAPSLLPPDPSATTRLLTLLELEKVVYELGYEVANRPDWVAIPAGGLVALLEAHR